MNINRKIVLIDLFSVGDKIFLLLPYGQKEMAKCISIDIHALRANLNSFWLFNYRPPFESM
jgi:hypothetical protein